MKPNYLFALVFLLMLPLMGIAQSTSNSNSPKEIIQLKEKLESFLKEKHIPGAMITVVSRDSTIYAGGIGLANMENQEEVTGNHLFRLGSISKSVTAIGLINFLLANGYELDSPIRNFIPDVAFSNDWSDEAPITIEHLLEHTAGFDDFHLHAMYNRTDSTRPSGQDIALSHRNSFDARWKPGVKKAYSNPGYIMAGYLLEVLAEQPFDQYLEAQILKPLGMNASGYYFKAPKDKLFAQGYKYNGRTHASVGFPSIQGGPAGEFSSNAIEMAHFLKFLLNRGAEQIDTSIFTDEIFDRIENANTSIAAKAGLPGTYGYGNYTIWRNGYMFNGHDGGIDGFSSRYLYSREANIGVSVAINRQGNATEIAHLILDFLMEENQNTANRKVYPIPVELKESHEGFYGFKSPKQQLTRFSERMLAGLILDFEDDKILVKSILGKHRDTLYYAGSNQFYKNNESVPATMLLTSEEGKPVFWINESYTEMESKTFRLISSISIVISMIIPFIFLAYGITWFAIRSFSKVKKPVKHHAVLWTSCLCYTLMALSFGIAMSDPYNAGTLSFPSIMLFISSILLVPGTIASISLWFKPFYGKGFKRFYVVTSLSLLIMTFFFFQNGFIALKLWAY